MPISINDIKKLSPKAKAGVVAVIFFLIGYLYWFYFLSSLMDQRNTLSAKLSYTESKITEKEKLASQLNKYKSDVATLQASYKIALQKLPDQREIPSLFHSVASAGKDAGIEFVLFEPKPAVPKVLEKAQAKAVATTLKPSDLRNIKPSAELPPELEKAGGKKAAEVAPEPFYEEIPVAVSVTGNYQNILYFFDKVAKLPRIVNVSDITMGDRKEAKGKGFVITASCMIKTYMFIDKKEKTVQKPSEKTK